MPFAVNSLDGIVSVLLRTNCFAVMPFHKVKPLLDEGTLRLASDRKYEKPLYLLQTKKRTPSSVEEAYKRVVLARGRLLP